jgi:thymidylate kinase
MNLIPNSPDLQTNASDNRSVAKGSANRPFLITFSGIDGAGKTTQIDHLASFLQQKNLRVLQFSFWDDVAVWSNMRAGVGQKTIDQKAIDQGTAQLPEHSFSPKNNKHIRKWYLTAARSGFYTLDTVSLRHLLASERVRNSDVVIFDRYIYDQIANIYSSSPSALIYNRILLNAAPTPDLPFIVDASPDVAFARKPEYPLEFVQRNRENFLSLRQLVPQLIVVSGSSVEEVENQIHRHVGHSRLAALIRGENPELAKVSTVVPPQTSRKVQNQPTASV